MKYFGPGRLALARGYAAVPQREAGGASDCAFVHSEGGRGAAPRAAHAAGYPQAVRVGARAPAGRAHL